MTRPMAARQRTFSNKFARRGGKTTPYACAESKSSSTLAKHTTHGKEIRGTQKDLQARL